MHNADFLQTLESTLGSQLLVVLKELQDGAGLPDEHTMGFQALYFQLTPLPQLQGRERDQKHPTTDGKWIKQLC